MDDGSEDPVTESGSSPARKVPAKKDAAKKVAPATAAPSDRGVNTRVWLALTQ